MSIWLVILILITIVILLSYIYREVLRSLPVFKEFLKAVVSNTTQTGGIHEEGFANQSSSNNDNNGANELVRITKPEQFMDETYAI